MSKTTKLAESHGVSRMTVSNWRRAGLLQFTDSGELDAEATDAALRAAGLGRYRKPAPPGAAPGADLAEAQRQREVALARLRRQQLEKLRAAWAPASDARAIWRAVAEHCHRNLRDIPNEVAPRLAALTDMAAIGEVIRDVTYEKLTLLSRAQAVATKEETPEPALPDDATHLAAETAKTIAIARFRELQAEIGDGGHVNADEFLHALRDAFMTVRARVLGAHYKLPPLVVMAKTEAARRAIVASEIEDAIAELPAAMPARLGDGNDEPEPEAVAPAKAKDAGKRNKREAAATH